MTSRAAGKGASEGAPSPSRREPYVGVAESLAARIFVDPDGPRAEQHRRALHRLFVASTTVFAVGAFVVIAIMLAAVIGN